MSLGSVTVAPSPMVPMPVPDMLGIWEEWLMDALWTHDAWAPWSVTVLSS